jgi:hypothetical protein
MRLADRKSVGPGPTSARGGLSAAHRTVGTQDCDPAPLKARARDARRWLRATKRARARAAPVPARGVEAPWRGRGARGSCARPDRRWGNPAARTTGPSVIGRNQAAGSRRSRRCGLARIYSSTLRRRQGRLHPIRLSRADSCFGIPRHGWDRTGQREELPPRVHRHRGGVPPTGIEIAIRQARTAAPLIP